MLYGGALASGALAGHVAPLPVGLQRLPRGRRRRRRRERRRCGLRLGDRLLRRPSAARAARPVAPRDPRAARSGRALVRALRRRRGPARLRRRRSSARSSRCPPGILEWPLRRFVPLAALGCTGLLLRRSPGSAGRSARAGTPRATTSATSTTSWSSVVVLRRRASWLVRRRTTATIRESDGDPAR